MLVGRDPKSFAEIARSISKARISVNSSALVLIHRQIRLLEHAVDGYEEKKKTDSTSENRKPIQARGPPMNVIRFAQTPGTEEATFEIFSQRSGLEIKNISENRFKIKLRAKTT